MTTTLVCTRKILSGNLTGHGNVKPKISPISSDCCCTIMYEINNIIIIIIIYTNNSFIKLHHFKVEIFKSI